MDGCFFDMISVQRSDPLNLENNNKLMQLSKQAAKWQDELSEFMKDKNFAFHYQVRIDRVKREIT